MKKVLVSLLVAISLLFVLAQDMPATVVDIAVGSPDHTTLVAAVTQAGLVETLSGEGPFTVFAPTDAAFEAALADMGITAEDLLANPDLASILTYHVVSGKLLAADVLAAVEAGGGTASVETVNGAPIEVTVMDGKVMINGAATVTVADLEAGNGVVHVIDAVLMPPAQ
jgi:transforming growth factor-beta-induced protein